MTQKRDYYEILGVARQASDDEIKRAYQKMAMKYHPDRNPGDPEAEERFKEAAEAYDVLGNPEKRQRYDRYGHAGVDGVAQHFGDARSVMDLFGDLLGQFFEGGRGGGPRGGRDLQIQIELDLAEVARGCRKTLTLTREENCSDCDGSGARRGSRPTECRRCGGAGVVIQRQGFFQVQQTCRACGGRGYQIGDPCPSCRGVGRVAAQRTLEVTIPAGVDTNMRVRVPGEGEAGEPGGPRGDLFCRIKVRPHPIFHRDGVHLLTQVPVTISQATLGGEMEVPTLDGPKPFHLPRGVQSGETLLLPGLGLPDPHGGRRGDLHIRVQVETPRNLSKRQEELFRELAELDHKHVSPERKGFFDKLREFFAPETPRTD